VMGGMLLVFPVLLLILLLVPTALGDGMKFAGGKLEGTETGAGAGLGE